MALLPNRNCALLGFQVTGDLGGYTAYTDKRGQVVWFPKAPPLNPPSVMQTYNRRKMATATQMWHWLTPQEQADWNTAAHRTHSRIAGFHLFIHYFLKPCDTAFERLQRASGLTLNKIAICQPSGATTQS